MVSGAGVEFGLVGVWIVVTVHIDIHHNHPNKSVHKRKPFATACTMADSDDNEGDICPLYTERDEHENEHGHVREAEEGMDRGNRQQEDGGRGGGGRGGDHNGLVVDTGAGIELTPRLNEKEQSEANRLRTHSARAVPAHRHSHGHKRYRIRHVHSGRVPGKGPSRARLRRGSLGNSKYMAAMISDIVKGAKAQAQHEYSSSDAEAVTKILRSDAVNHEALSEIVRRSSCGSSCGSGSGSGSTV